MTIAKDPTPSARPRKITIRNGNNNIIIYAIDRLKSTVIVLFVIINNNNNNLIVSSFGEMCPGGRVVAIGIIILYRYARSAERRTIMFCPGDYSRMLSKIAG